MARMFVPTVAKVVDIVDETGDIRTLTIEVNDEKGCVAVPGQFVELTLFGYGEFPVSVSGIGEAGEWIRTTVQAKGKTTRAVADLKIGESVGIRGPFGKGYPYDRMVGKDVYVVTGGIGLAAVWLLVDTLVKNRERYGKMTLFHGARCAEDLIYKDSFLLDEARAADMGIKVLTTVDAADACWDGNIGLVTSLFENVDLSAEDGFAVVCGPEIMMKAACRDLMARGFDEHHIILSMERRMQCGMGTCGHCMVGEKRVCVDGPVFEYAEIRTGLDRLL